MQISSMMLGELVRAAEGGTASSIMAVAGIVLALVFLRRSWSIALLVIAACVVALAANVLSVVAVPIDLTLVSMVFTGAMKPDRVHTITDLYGVGASLVSTLSMAGLLAAALLTIRGVTASKDKARIPWTHERRERFLVGMAYTGVGTVLAAILVVALLGVAAAHGLAKNAPKPTPTPIGGCTGGGAPGPASPPIDPGTYQAGKLKAPQKLLGQCLEPTTSSQDVKQARDARDSFSKDVGGGPAIFANYGFLMQGMQLYAAEGYETAQQYFGGSKVNYTTYGQVTCGTAGVSICIRSDQAQNLVVVVSGLGDAPTIAQAVDEAWADQGGH